MTLFPLLKSPFLVQEAIISNLDPRARIFLSVTSNRVRRIVSCFKAPLSSMNINANKNGIYVEISNLKIFVEHKKLSSTNPLIWNIDGIRTAVNLNFYFRDKVRISAQAESQVLKTLGIVVRHLTNIFNDKMVNLNSNTVVKYIEFSNELRFIDRFHEVRIGTNTERAHMDLEEFTFALENITADTLILNNKISTELMNYTYQKKHNEELNIGKLSLENVCFVDFANLPTVRNLRFEITQFTSKSKLLFDGANTVLKSWISGRGNQFVEFVTFRWCSREEPFDMVLHGVRTAATQLAKVQIERIPWHFHYQARTVDIIRETDGLRATVTVNSHGTLMMTWTEKNLRKIGRTN